ncbi:MAG: RNA polymerase sigma factor [Solirubrobacteraceae bacterium]
MALFRAGHDDAFRAIHDRYRQRLFAYTRQMLPARPDAEDALQDVFVRAYSGLRASQGRLVLRAWLYRIAHNRCIDELRRPAPPPPEVLELVRTPADDPIAAAATRESLRRLVIDVRRLPEQQRSALLMRELGGMAYADMADALGVSVPAVKSLLVRARIALAQALEARDTACSEIRGQLTLAHDRGVRPGGSARRHMRDCSPCRHFHHELRGISRRFAALAPTVGPMGLVAKVLGLGGGAGGSAAAGSGAIAAGGVAGTGGAVASVGLFATGAGHIVTLIAAAAVTAGGAVEIQSSIAPPGHHVHHTRPAATAPAPSSRPDETVVISQSAPAPTAAPQAVIVPAREDSTGTLPVRHKQTPRQRRVPVGHITDPAAQTPSSTSAGSTDSTGTTSTTDGSTTTGGSVDTNGSPNGTSSTTTTTTDPVTALDQSSSTTTSTGNGSPPATSTSSPGTTSSGAPTTGPATIGTTTASSSPSSTSGSGNGA